MQRNHLYFKGIPEYVNMLEDARKRLERASLPISGETITTIAIRLMLASGKYLTKCEWGNQLPQQSRTEVQEKLPSARPTCPGPGWKPSAAKTDAPLTG